MFDDPCTGNGAMDCQSVKNSNIKVTPVPYMTERAPAGLTQVEADNTPRDVDEQSEIIKNLYGRALNIDASYAKTWPRFGQQFEKFKAFLAARLVPDIQNRGAQDANKDASSAFQAALEKSLPEQISHEDHGKEIVAFSWEDGAYETGPAFTKAQYLETKGSEINIAIVGHNQMMSEYCLKNQGAKPNNNAVLEKLFILNTTHVSFGKKFVLQELDENCAKVMDAPPKDLNSLTNADVASCSDPFQVSKFLGLEEGSLESGNCVSLALREDAYPIQPGFNSSSGLYSTPPTSDHVGW
jgi:hypothetical protein